MANLGLDIGIRALLTSRSALDTIGHNLANANTPGYSRQELAVSTSRTQLLRGLGLGSGVQADVVRRTTDALLVRRIGTQTSVISRLDTRLAGLSELESLLGEPGSAGIGERLNGFFGSFSSLANDPTEASLRAGVVQSATSMTERFHELASHLAVLGEDTRTQAAAQVDQANVLSARISDLNRQVRELEARGVPANDLRDSREQALSELAKLVDVRWQEDASGAISVHTKGQLLVGAAGPRRLRLEQPAGEQLRLLVQGSTKPFVPQGGTLGALAELSGDTIPGYAERLDALAKSLILAANQAHGTSLPASGPFRKLGATWAFQDHDGDGELLDESLAQAGLPFDVGSGELFVHVSELDAGSFRTERIAIDPERTTVGKLVAAFDGIDGLSASLDGQGRLQILASSGLGFDFTTRLNAQPDLDGTFGGANASLVLGQGEPYALSGGATLDLVTASGPLSVTLPGGAFADATHASADELAAALNADAGFSGAGMRAVVVGERVALQTQGSGASESFTVAGGSALAALGLAAGTTVTGHDVGVSVTLGGTHGGAQNEHYTFEALGEGTIGATPGLQVGVRDSSGALIATLEVGEGYAPGTPLAFGDGLSVSFGLGELSASAGDRFVADALANSDGAGLVGALGLNALLTGTSARDVALRADIEADPSLLASALGGGAGDNRGALALAAVAERPLDALGGRTLGASWGSLVSDLGFDTASAADARDMEGALMDGLVQRREQVSGVDVDQQLVDMIREEQAFSAASQYIQVVQQTLDEVLNLL